MAPGLVSRTVSLNTNRLAPTYKGSAPTVPVAKTVVTGAQKPHPLMSGGDIRAALRNQVDRLGSPHARYLSGQEPPDVGRPADMDSDPTIDGTGGSGNGDGASATFVTLNPVYTALTQLPHDSPLRQNPLLFTADGQTPHRVGDLPRFGEIEPEHFLEALECLMTITREQGERFLETLPETPTWEQAMVGFEEVTLPLEVLLKLVVFLKYLDQRRVIHSDETKKAAQVDLVAEAQGVVNQIKSDPRLVAAWKNMSGLTDLQRQAVEALLRPAHLLGSDLEGDAREALAQTDAAISAAAARFSGNMQGKIPGTYVIVRDPEHFVDVSDDVLSSTKDKAARAYNERADKADDEEPATAETGPWLFEYGDWRKFLSLVTDPTLRREMVAALSSPGGHPAYSNVSAAVEIANLRRKRAQELTGDPDASFLSTILAGRFLADIDGIERYLTRLSDAVAAVRRNDAAEISPYLVDKGLLEPGEAVDDLAMVTNRDAFVSEKYQIDGDPTLEWFTLESVLRGVQALLREDFDLNLVEIDVADEGIPVWTEGVRAFRLTDAESGEDYGVMYFDPYNSGRKLTQTAVSWEAFRRRTNIDGNVELPWTVISLGDVAEGGEQNPALNLTQARSIMHEMGHVLAHLLSGRDEVFAFSGSIQMPSDAIEIPSTALERYADMPDVALRLSLAADQGPEQQDEFRSMLATWQQSETFGLAALTEILPLTRAKADISIQNITQDTTAEELLTALGYTGELPEHTALKPWYNIFIIPMYAGTLIQYLTAKTVGCALAAWLVDGSKHERRRRARELRRLLFARRGGGDLQEQLSNLIGEPILDVLGPYLEQSFGFTQR